MCQQNGKHYKRQNNSDFNYKIYVGTETKRQASFYINKKEKEEKPRQGCIPISIEREAQTTVASLSPYSCHHNVFPSVPK